MDPIDKLAWICLAEGKFLCTRSRGKDLFYLPGGKREPGESDRQALTREIREEVSVDLLPATLRHLETFTAQAHGKPPGVMVRLTCYTADYTGQLGPAAEIEELRWLGAADRPLCSEAAALILDWLV